PHIRPAGVLRRPAPRAAVLDPVVEAIVSLVSTTNLSVTVQTLQDFQTRHTNTSGCRMAGDYLLGAFTALGLENVGFEVFGAAPGSRNVIGEKIGTRFPDDTLIICAHYDSTSPFSSTLAPGADDNASGTAAVVEAARILVNVPLDFTVRFIAFSGEEQGLFGSRAHASGAASRGERIVGIINLDMIGYSSVLPESMEVYVNGFSDWLGTRLLDASSSYGGPSGNKRVDPSMVYSDHSPFWDNGYAALLAIETDFNPYYHQTTDTLDKLNLAFFTHVTRASLGLLAELAQPLREGYPRAPLGLVAETTVYSSLFSSLKTFQLSWDPQSDAAGYNVYRSNLSHLDYQRINTLPIVGTSFSDADIDVDETAYYVVTAVGPTGLESNRSVEVTVVGGTLGAPAWFPGPLLLRFAGGR
ncbi:MAG: M20/M25/M40 family metallo-hydrolase, partial [Candidatus Aminicenantes bacterium]|nr:M20/M25/M40 family metallo-hydrolase [Candidatus Aminicenantes bacterium]